MFGILIYKVTPNAPWRVYKPDPWWLSGGSYVWIPICEVIR